MAMATTLERYLADCRVPYDVIPHPHTFTTMEAARAAQVPEDEVAKTVVLGDTGGYMLAILPASHRIDLERLRRHTHRQVWLASERELSELFDDCDIGAIPPCGGAYGMEVIWDDALDEREDVYFEAGDHEELVHVRGEDFRTLMGNAPHTRFSVHR